MNAVSAQTDDRISPAYQEGDYLHQCPYVGHHIDETSDEFLQCQCFDGAEVLALQDKLAVAIDARRGNTGP
jgi:hypothetical protein